MGMGGGATGYLVGGAGGGAAGFEVTGGGSIGNYNGYEVATFTSPGTLTVTGGCNAHILVVAGGGGGGGGNGGFGGGGAGGLIYIPINPSDSELTEGQYSITIGQGGSNNTNGGDSTILTSQPLGNLYARGGGGGSTWN